MYMLAGKRRLCHAYGIGSIAFDVLVIFAIWQELKGFELKLWITNFFELKQFYFGTFASNIGVIALFHLQANNFQFFHELQI